MCVDCLVWPVALNWFMNWYMQAVATQKCVVSVGTWLKSECCPQFVSCSSSIDLLYVINWSLISPETWLKSECCHQLVSYTSSFGFLYVIKWSRIRHQLVSYAYQFLYVSIGLLYVINWSLIRHQLVSYTVQPRIHIASGCHTYSIVYATWLIRETWPTYPRHDSKVSDMINSYSKFLFWHMIALFWHIHMNVTKTWDMTHI
jgi:hypothetical protein